MIHFCVLDLSLAICHFVTSPLGSLLVQMLDLNNKPLAHAVTLSPPWSLLSAAVVLHCPATSESFVYSGAGKRQPWPFCHLYYLPDLGAYNSC